MQLLSSCASTDCGMHMYQFLVPYGPRFQMSVQEFMHAYGVMSTYCGIHLEND